MNDIMKCAEELQDYCKSHKECSNCRFLRQVGGCVFARKLPDEWELERIEEDEEFLKRWTEAYIKGMEKAIKIEVKCRVEGTPHLVDPPSTKE